jgi:chromosome segregation protein
LTYERNNLGLKIREIESFETRLQSLVNELEQDIADFKYILGSFKLHNVDQKIENEEDFQSLKRSIERLKIRLEESQVPNPDEVIKNFDDLTEKDNFLVKEIADLESSMLNLEKLIEDLKQSLKEEFDMGLTHINKVFDSYVKRLFGGGSGKVSVVEIESKKKSVEGEEVEDEEDEELKTGVDVEVEIPKKKVKGLQSLSGGERALVSIALNFSIINQNPAPFMILDETDAALDEANSKRYGEILEMLKQQTKLIVVTHNRETMHFADQVYGVTIGKDGHSKVLSVSFEDAVEYAK